MRKLALLISILSLTSCLKDNDTVTFEEQLAIDIDIIDNYLEENGIQTEVHSSGIRYIVDNLGDGAPLTEDDVFVSKYTGNLLGGGLIFESKYGSSFTLNQNLLTAWRLVLPEINEGGKIRIFAPSGYCFGIQSSSNFPPNSIFEFDLDIVRIVDSMEEQLTADTVILNEYLADNQITYETHESGIRFVVTEEGTGDAPSLNDNIVVKYKGYYTNDAVFDQNTVGATFNLSNLIQAWKIMIPQMREGGKMTIYAPSQYCYGVNGSEVILPNTVLLFDIELVGIE